MTPTNRGDDRYAADSDDGPEGARGSPDDPDPDNPPPARTQPRGELPGAVPAGIGPTAGSTQAVPPRAPERRGRSVQDQSDDGVATNTGGEEVPAGGSTAEATKATPTSREAAATQEVLGTAVSKLKLLHPEFKTALDAVARGAALPAQVSGVLKFKGLERAVPCVVVVGPQHGTGKAYGPRDVARGRSVDAGRSAPDEAGSAVSEVDRHGENRSSRAVPGWAVYASLGLGAASFVLLLMLVWSTPKTSRVAEAETSRAAPAVPEGFAQEVAAHVKVSPPDTAELRRLADAVSTLERKTAGQPAPQAPTLPPPAVGLSKQEKEQLLADVRSAVQGAAKAPAGPPPAGGPSGSGDPFDVLVIITHGATMDAGAYLPALREAIVKRPRGKDQLVRVGLALGRSNKLAVSVPPEAAAAKLDGFPNPVPEDKEEPALLGGKVKKEFSPERGRQRAVLVVSTACDPVPPNAPGWDELSDVHVVVVARKELGPADRERLARWYEFTDSTRGTVHLVGHPTDSNRQNTELAAALKRVIRLAD